MKHKWTIVPRGKVTKYYICERCDVGVVAISRKEADAFFAKCKGEQK